MNNSNDSAWLRALKALGNGVLTLIVTPFMLLNELRRELNNTVYQKNDGWFRAIIGGILAFLAAGYTGYHLGWVSNWSAWTWVPSGVGAWFATYCYLWPLFYLFPVKPAFKLASLGWDGLERVTKPYAERFFGGIVSALGKVLPGSGNAWKKVNDKKENWVTKIVGVLSYFGSGATGVYAGYKVYAVIAAASSSVVFGTTTGVFCGLLTALLAISLFWQCIEYGKLNFIAIGLATGLDLIYQQKVLALASLLHIEGVYVYVLNAALLLTFVAYAFPLAHLALSGGFIKWVIEQLKPINKETYDDHEKDYAKFFHNVMTLSLTAVALFYAVGWLVSVGMPIWAFTAMAAVLLLVSYLWIYELLDNGGGNFFLGAGISVYAGYKLGACYVALGLTGGLWIAIPLGIVSALLFGYTAFPIAYVLLKRTSLKTGLTKAGVALEKFHTSVEEKAKKVAEKLWTVYDNSYRDRSGYQVWFWHATNIAIAVLLALSLPVLGAKVHIAWLATVLCSITAQVVTGLLSYLLVGKFLQKSNIGNEFLGGVSSLALAVWFCSVAVATGSSTLVTVLIGCLAWVVGVGLLFPAVYIAFRYPAKYVLASWSTKLLVTVYDFAWSLFSVVWEQVLRVYRVVDNALFIPLRNAFMAAMRRVNDAYNWVRDRIIGRHS